MPDPVSALVIGFGATGAVTLAQAGASPAQATDSLGQALDAVSVNATGLTAIPAPGPAPDPGAPLPAPVAPVVPAAPVAPVAPVTPATPAAPAAPTMPAAAQPAAPAQQAPALSPPGLDQAPLPPSPPAPPAATAPLGLPDAPGLAAGAGNLTAHVTPPEMFGMDSGLLHTGFVTAAWLCLLLGVIFLACWLLRRFGPAGLRRTNSAMAPRLAGRLMLGNKQSVAVVKVLDRVLVLGATERQITLLHSQSAQECRDMDEDEDEHAFTQFAEMLGRKQDGGDDA
ncbi:MAG: flagellar biosynthetic protein FliO [Desulfovibrionaceae bacterium]